MLLLNCQTQDYTFFGVDGFKIFDGMTIGIRAKLPKAETTLASKEKVSAFDSKRR